GRPRTLRGSLPSPQARGTRVPLGGFAEQVEVEVRGLTAALGQVHTEDVGAVIPRWKVHEDGRKAAFAYLLGGKLAHVVGGGDDEHARMRLSQPVQQRTHHPAGRTAIGAG